MGTFTKEGWYKECDYGDLIVHKREEKRKNFGRRKEDYDMIYTDDFKLFIVIGVSILLWVSLIAYFW